jgi:hypothetical protein
LASRRRLRFALAGSVLLLFLLGLFLVLRYGSSANSPNAPSTVRIHVVSMTSNSTSLHCMWQVTGNESWSAFNGRNGPGPGGTLTLVHYKDLWGRLSDSGSNIITYELTVSLGSKTAPGQTSYSEAVEMMGNHGNPCSGTTGGFSSAATTMQKLAVVLVKNDVTITSPGRVVFATVDGQPLTLEFGK